MISFKPSDEEAAFIMVAKDFATEYFRPMARDAERNDAVPEQIIRKLRELGLNALELPECFGGLELPLLSQVQILESLSYGDLGILQGIGGAGECASIIRLEHANPVFELYKQKCQIGEEPTVALYCHEQHSLQIRKTAEGFLINGETAPIKMAREAEYLLIAGKDTDGEDHLLWLDYEEETSWEIKDGDYRLGLLCSGFAQLAFNGVRVPKSSVIASGKSAVDILELALSRIRIREAAKETGVMSAALDYTAEYTAQRKAFGQEIAKFQGVSFNLAQMAIHTQTARHLTLYGASKLDQQDKDAVLYSIEALQKAHQSIRFVTDSAVQLLGGHGYVADHPVEKWMRDAQAQISWFEKEGDLQIKAGNWILNHNERGASDDQLRAVLTPKPS